MEKTALIIGGSSGIGLAVAELLQKNNYKVYNASRRVCPITQVNSFFLDVADTERIVPTINNFLHDIKEIDLLVYSAGFSMASPVEKVDMQDYTYLFRVNFFGAIESIKAVVPVMQKQNSGKIILISSIGSTIPIPYDPYYCASKAAIDALTKNLYLELQPYNISITSVLPGGTQTPFSYKRKVEEKGKDNVFMNNAVKALGKIEQKGMTPEEVSKTVFKVAESACPPVTIVAGFKNKFTVLAQKVLPYKLLSVAYRKKFFGNG